MPPSRLSEAGRIERLITLAYLLSAHDEIAIDEIEERFNITTRQVEEDLNQLMFCGLPPYSPDQLFDISIEDGFVSMYFNDVFVAPMKLNDSERTNATIALTRLRQESTIEERRNIDEILELLNAVKKQVVEVENSSVHIKLFQKAIEQNLVVKITYLSLNSGTIDQREIDPKKILTTASSSYIHAYCHRDGTMKLFRTDRISSAELTEKQSESKEIISTLDVSDDEQVPFVSASKHHIILKVSRDASWILDTYPHDKVKGSDDHYKFDVSNPFVAARMFLAAGTSIEYISGTITIEEISESVKTMHARINE